MKINTKYRCNSVGRSLVPVFALDKKSAPDIVHDDDTVVVTGPTADGYVPIRFGNGRASSHDGFIEEHWFLGAALELIT